MLTETFENKFFPYCIFLPTNRLIIFSTDFPKKSSNLMGTTNVNFR